MGSSQPSVLSALQALLKLLSDPHPSTKQISLAPPELSRMGMVTGRLARSPRWENQKCAGGPRDWVPVPQFHEDCELLVFLRRRCLLLLSKC